MGMRPGRPPLWEDSIGEAAKPEEVSDVPRVDPKGDERDHFMERLAWAVRSAREERGWTQEALSRRTGIPVKTISRIESSWARSRYKRRPQMETIRKLVEALKIKEWELSGW